MAAYITVGATTTHGGKVISGSPHTTHNGIPVSRKGDKVICRKCKKLTTILTGDPSFIVDGAPIARAGDVTSCGAKLIAVQQSFCESDFEVMGVEQPAPLVFPKSDPEALFASLAENDEEESKDVRFAVKVVEFNSEGDYMGSYDLADNPSDLLVADSTWYKEEGTLNKGSALLKDSYKLAVDNLSSYFGGAKRKGKELVKETKASGATAMLQFGQSMNVDFVYVAGGGGFRNFGLETAMSVNVHNGKVYEPVAANANVNTNKAPSIGVQLGVGRIINSNIKSRVEATDVILSGQGHSYSVEFGPANAALETTHDGSITSVTGGIAKDYSLKAKKGSSSTGASKGSTNMEQAADMKYNSAKNIIEYVGK